MSIKDDFYVESIPKEETYDWLIHKHYAHCLPNIIYSFGLFDKDKILQGVCCYGTPANNHNNLMGKFRQIELVRLVINELNIKNILSFFVSRTFEMLDKPLSLISYADDGKNHHGYIYQATNWIYTGLGGALTSIKMKMVEKFIVELCLITDLNIPTNQETKYVKCLSGKRYKEHISIDTFTFLVIEKINENG